MPGWGIDSSVSVRLARLAIASGLYPVFEMENGTVTKVRKINRENLVKVEEFLKPQKRFAHLFRRPGGEEHIAAIQSLADANIESYGLLAK